MNIHFKIYDGSQVELESLAATVAEQLCEKNTRFENKLTKIVNDKKYDGSSTDMLDEIFNYFEHHIYNYLFKEFKIVRTDDDDYLQLIDSICSEMLGFSNMNYLK